MLEAERKIYNEEQVEGRRESVDEIRQELIGFLEECKKRGYTLEQVYNLVQEDKMSF